MNEFSCVCVCVCVWGGGGGGGGGGGAFINFHLFRHSAIATALHVQGITAVMQAMSSGACQCVRHHVCVIVLSRGVIH